MRTLLAIMCAALAFTLAGCQGDSSAKPPPVSGTSTAPITDPALARVHSLFQSCKVKKTVSLHDGTFYVELRDGTRINLPKRIEKAVYAEPLPRRCPAITAEME